MYIAIYTDKNKAIMNVSNSSFNSLIPTESAYKNFSTLSIEVFDILKKQTQPACNKITLKIIIVIYT